MVGHTGIMEAAIIAVETVDQCLGDLLEVIREKEGVAVVTADHGNADVMFTYGEGNSKKVRTAHSLSPVPFAIFDSQYRGEYEMAGLEKRGLSNVASTILNLLGYEKVGDYDPSLIRFREP